MKKFCLVIAVILVFVCSCDNLYNEVAEEKKDMQKLIFVNADGVSVDLTKDPFGITEWEGFSKVDLNLQTQQVPFHDGSVYLDGLLSERELSVTLAMNDNKNLEKRYRLRRELIEILNPKLGEGTLIYTNNYTSKQIKVVPQTPLFENHNSNNVGTPKASLAWTACDPYWEDVEDTVVEFDMLNSITINNEGDVPIQFKCNIVTAFVQNVTLRNMTTAKRIKLQGTLNTPVEIDTQYGQKSVFEKDINVKWICGGILNNLIEDDEKIYVFGNHQIITIDEKEEIGNVPQEEIIQTETESLYHDGLFLKSLPMSYSYDAKNWTPCTLTGTSSQIITDVNRLVFLNGNYYAVGKSNFGQCIMRSSDGITWNTVLNYQDGDIKTICYSPSLNKFLAGGAFGHSYYYMYTSTDGETWQPITTETSNTCYALSWSETYSKFVRITGSVSSKGLDESSDGQTWTNVNFTIIGGGKKSTIISVEPLGLIVTAHLHPNRTALVITYYDGETWKQEFKTDVIYTRQGTEYVRDLIYSFVLNKFILCGDSGVFYLGSNVNDMESFGTGIEMPLMSVICKDNVFFGVGRYRDVGRRATSQDGKNWVWNDVSFPCNKIMFSEIFNKFYIVGDKNSSSGTTDQQIMYADSWEVSSWRYADPIIGTYFNAIAEGNGKLLVGGADLYETTDGVNFSAVQSNIQTEETIYMMCFFNGLFYANISNDLRTSPDGVTWTSTGFNYGRYYLYTLNNILFAGNKYTKDGVNWRSIDAYGVPVYDENKRLYFFANDEGKVYISSDLQHFTQIASFLGNLVSGCYNQSLKAVLISASNTGSGGSINDKSIYITQDIQDENRISMLSPTSDMNMSLEKGANVLQLSYESGSAKAVLTYRQKYIGV